MRRKRKPGSNWAFKMMSIIHDNPFRRKFSNPWKILEEAGLKSGQRVLEIGCGPGFYTIPAAQIVSETGIIFALDIHPLAIKRVEEKIKKEGISNVKTILTDAADTGISDQSIDLAFLFGLPRLLRDVDLFSEILEEMFRVIRSGGIISIKSSNKKIIETVESKMFSFLTHKNGILLFTK